MPRTAFASHRSGLWPEGYHSPRAFNGRRPWVRAGTVNTRWSNSALYVQPILIPAGATFDRVVFNVGSGFTGTGNARLGLFAHDPLRGGVGRLVADWGTQVVSGVGIFSKTIDWRCSRTGLYWLAMLTPASAHGGQTVRAFGLFMEASALTMNQAAGYRATGMGTTFPERFPSASVSAQALMPWMLLRVASSPQIAEFQNRADLRCQGLYGNYFQEGHAFTEAASPNLAIAANQIVAEPFMVTKPGYIGVIQVIVNTAQASADGYLCIYSNSHEGYPRNLMWASALQDFSTTGGKTATVALSLPPGIYWAALQLGGVSNVAFEAYQRANLMYKVGVADVNFPSGMIRLASTGAPPAVFPTGTVNENVSSVIGVGFGAGDTNPLDYAYHPHPLEQSRRFIPHHLFHPTWHVGPFNVPCTTETTLLFPILGGGVGSTHLEMFVIDRPLYVNALKFVVNDGDGVFTGYLYDSDSAGFPDRLMRTLGIHSTGPGTATITFTPQLLLPGRHYVGISYTSASDTAYIVATRQQDPATMVGFIASRAWFYQSGVAPDPFGSGPTANDWGPNFRLRLAGYA